MGEKVNIPKYLPKHILAMVELENKLYGFHNYRSDLIGYHRSLLDQRDEWCEAPNRFLKDLPSTSVVIPVYNEAWSTLIRTVNSIIINSPPELIHEIILVVDSTDLAHLKTLLEDHFINLSFLRSPKTINISSPKTIHHPKTFKSPTMKIIHTKKREGLIRAKNLGAQHATGEVLTFLDSHCECTKGWLEPLLDRIAKNSTTIAVPLVGNIHNDTFKYFSAYSTAVGFNWGLGFKPISIPKREKLRRSHEAEPFYTPIMYGGLYSISRAFFEKLGGYDGGLELWGGENVEISFKGWMCGGCVEIVPCSQVGHIYRSRDLPYHNTSRTLDRNIGRIAEVWMDEYVEYHYWSKKRVDVGNISEQSALRVGLKCKSFDWYLRNVYPELPIPNECLLHGEVKNEKVPKIGKDSRMWANLTSKTWICLDSLSGNPNRLVGLFLCHGKLGNQYWLLTKSGEIRQGDDCLDYAGDGLYGHRCHGLEGNQFWTYSNATKLLVHGSTDLCLAVGEDRTFPVMLTCDGKDENQLWMLENNE